MYKKTTEKPQVHGKIRYRKRKQEDKETTHELREVRYGYYIDPKDNKLKLGFHSYD